MGLKTNAAKHSDKKNPTESPPKSPIFGGPSVSKTRLEAIEPLRRTLASRPFGIALSEIFKVEEKDCWGRSSWITVLEGNEVPSGGEFPASFSTKAQRFFLFHAAGGEKNQTKK